MESKPDKLDTDKLSQPTGVAQPVPDRDIDRDAGRTPGANNPNATPEKDANEVVPVSPGGSGQRNAPPA